MSGRYTIPEAADLKELQKILNNRLEEIEQRQGELQAGVDGAQAEAEAAKRSAGRRRAQAGTAGSRPAPLPGVSGGETDNVNVPTNVAMAVLDRAGNYGFETTFVKPDPIGDANEWEIQAGVWQDEAMTINDVDPDDAKNWITLGTTWETRLVSGYWPRPTDISKWALIRVRSMNTKTGTTSAWVEAAAPLEITAYTDSYVPPDPAGVPTSPTLAVTTINGDYYLASGWTSGAGGTTDFEVSAWIWRDASKTENDIDADDAKNFVILGGTWEQYLNSGPFKQPEEIDKYVEIKVRAKNAANEYSAWSAASSLETIPQGAAPGTEPAAPNIDAITAAVAEAGALWGFTADLDWGDDTSNIDHGYLYIVGPIGTTEERRQLWANLIPTDLSVSQTPAWIRPKVGEADQQYRLELETYNSTNVPTPNPVASAEFTVTAMASDLAVTDLTGARNPTLNGGDGVEVYGIVGEYTIPDYSEIDHAELTIYNTSDAEDRERMFTVTGAGGGDNGTTVEYATDLWQIPVTDPFVIRVTVYLVNRAGERMAAGVFVDVTITPGNGALDLARSSAASRGKGLAKSGTQLVTTIQAELLNEDFEHWDSDTEVRDWVRNTTPIFREGTIKYSGNYSLRIAAAAADSFVARNIPTFHGQRITFKSVIANNTGADVPTTSGCYAVIVWVNAAGGGISAAFGNSGVGIPRDAGFVESVVSETAPAGAVSVNLYPLFIVGRANASGYAYVDQASLNKTGVGPGQTLDANGNVVPDLAYPLGIDGSGKTGVTGNIPGSQVTNIPAASIAAGLEFVADVTGTPNSDGDLVISRVTTVVRNTYDNQMYRWDSLTNRYKKKVGTPDIYTNSITSALVVAGAVGTRELATVEIRIGAGGGKPPKLTVVDAGGTMIDFIGDDSAGFVGAYFQRLRVAPYFNSSQRIEATASGVAMENVPLTINGNGFTTEINPVDGVKVSRWSDSAYVSLNSNIVRVSNNLGTSTVDLDPNGILKTIPGAFFAIKDIGADLRLAFYPYSNQPLNVGVNISGGHGYMTSDAPNSYVNLTGNNSWIRAQQLRVNGVSETINYNGTWVKCFYVYDYNTGLQWKVPLIP